VRGGQTVPTTCPAFLCVCGQSANKPYCDYSHGEKGWQDGDPE